MRSDWQAMTLAQAGVSLIDCDHRTPPATDTGYPYVAIPQLVDGHIDFSSARRISREHLVEWTKKLKPQQHDVVVVRRCNSGVSAVVPKGVEFAIGQNLVVLRADGKRVHPQFLRWLVRGEEWWEQVRKYMNVGAVFDSLKCRDIPNFEVLIPGLNEQEHICEVLDALDDRIDLLRQTNTTLESIAQALFRSWFVNFDPVRAKQAGREPEGMDAATAALFPAEFEESALGLIPKGWHVSEVGQTAECVGGGTPSTKEAAYWEPPVHSWATPKDLSGLGSPVLWATERRLSDAGLKKVSSGLLPSGTLLMSSRAPIGYLAVSMVPVSVNQGFIAMRPGGLLPPVYLYFWCQAHMDAIKQKANGSTFMEISKAAFRPISLVLPPREVVASFSEIAGALFERIAANEQQRAGLTDLRDTLLPRLISGKLRLPEAQEQLEDALT